MTLQLQTAATGVARGAHYVVPTGQTQPIPTLLLEPQRTNLFTQSEDASSWTNYNTCNITANAIAAPDGALTADLLTSTATNSARGQTCAFTGDGEKCAAIYVKAGTSTRTDFEVRDITAAVTRHSVRMTWTAGVPTLSTTGGAGTLYPVEALANGWYRILVSATGVVAANSNVVRIYPDTLVGTGTVYAWGAQAENAVVPSSYIKTEGTTQTRNPDSLYFPFTAAPQAMTVYLRGVDRGAYQAQTGVARILHIGDANPGTDPRFGLNRNAAATSVQALYDNGPTLVAGNVTPSPLPQLGSIVEHRGVLRADWGATVGISVNGGTEQTNASVVGGTTAAWANTRLYLAGLTQDNDIFAFTHIAIATGEQTRETMRQIAGVV